MAESWEERFRKELAETKAEMDGVFTGLKDDLQQIGEQTKADLATVKDELTKQHEKRTVGITAVGEAERTLQVMAQDDPASKFEQIGRSIAGQRLGAVLPRTDPYTRQLRADSRASDITAVQNAVDGVEKPVVGLHSKLVQTQPKGSKLEL